MGRKLLQALNIRKRCAKAGVRLWQCPHFLFPVMGVVIIVAIIATNIVAQRFSEPEIAALIVLVVTSFLFIIGHTIVRSFENIVEAARLKSEFVRIVSHELRSPLSAIKWSLEALTYNHKPFPQEFSSTLMMIDEENKKMLRLISNLLAVRLIEDQKLDLEPQRFSLKDLTQKVITRLDPFARASNVTVKLVVPHSVSEVFADSKKIDLVIENLLDNAIRYNVKKGTAMITIEEKPGTVIWTIKDEGVGIPKEDIKKVFDKFFRSHNVFQYRAGGLGMGLFLAQAFVRASGSKIRFRSRERKGSTFWFTLPIKSVKGQRD